MTNILSTAQAAAILGLTPDRVIKLAHAGKIPAERVGRTWVFEADTVEQFKKQKRRPGRPTKQ